MNKTVFVNSEIMFLFILYGQGKKLMGCLKSR